MLQNAQTSQHCKNSRLQALSLRALQASNFCTTQAISLLQNRFLHYRGYFFTTEAILYYRSVFFTKELNYL